MLAELGLLDVHFGLDACNKLGNPLRSLYVEYYMCLCSLLFLGTGTGAGGGGGLAPTLNRGGGERTHRYFALPPVQSLCP